MVLVVVLVVSLPATAAATCWWTARRCGAVPADVLAGRRAAPASPGCCPPPAEQLPSWFLLDREEDPALDPAACFSCNGAGVRPRPCRRCLGTGLS